MASYDESSLKDESYHPHPQHIVPQYPPPPEVEAPRNENFNDQLYPNTDPALQPAGQPVALHPAPLPQQHASTPKSHKPQGHGENGGAKEIKNRLRKACDSCSARKVKVGCDRYALHDTMQDTLADRYMISAMRIHHAKPASLLKYHVHLIDPASGEVLPTAMRTRSRSSGRTNRGNQSSQSIPSPVHLRMLHTHSPRFPNSKFSQSKPSCHGQSFRRWLMITLHSSTR